MEGGCTVSQKWICSWLVRIGSIALVTVVAGYLSQISGATHKMLPATSSEAGEASSGSSATEGSTSLRESDSLPQPHAGAQTENGDSGSNENSYEQSNEGGFSGDAGYSNENQGGFTLTPPSPGQPSYVHPHTRSRAS